MLCRIVAEDRVGAAAPAPWATGATATHRSSAPAPFVYENNAQGERTAADTAANAAFSKELEERIREARLAGYAEGEAAGRRIASDEIRPVLEQLGKSIAELTAARADYLRQAEADVVRLSLAVARRILHRELTVDPGATSGLVKAAIEKLQAEVSAQARVHPEQESAVRAVVAKSGRSGSIEVVADPSLEQGGVVFETSRGSLDATIEMQLREIELGFADRFRRPLSNAAAV